MVESKDKKRREKGRARTPNRVPGRRASRTDAELYRRRIEIFRAFSSGATTRELADQWQITTETVRDDIKFIRDVYDPDEVKGTIELGYKEIIRRNLDDAKTAKPELKPQFYRVASETLSRMARLFGFEQSINQINFTQNQTLIQSVNNPYSKMDDAELEKELARRRALVKSI